MSWDTVFESGGSDKKKAEFTKFPEGITRIRVVDDVPYARWTHWFPQFKRSFNCTGFDCPICAVRKAQKAAGEQPKIGVAQRFAINILNRETGNVEIMEQGKKFFEELREFNRDEGDLRTYDLKVKRKGKNQDDTSYRVDKDVVTPLTEIEISMINDNATNLKEYFKPHTVEQATRLLAGESWEEVMKADQSEVAESDSEDEQVELS